MLNSTTTSSTTPNMPINNFLQDITSNIYNKQQNYYNKSCYTQDNVPLFSQPEKSFQLPQLEGIQCIDNCLQLQQPSSSTTKSNEQQQQQQQTQICVQRYKTEICKNWEINQSCLYGKKCKFAHGKVELIDKPEKQQNKTYKTKHCQNFITHGYCRYGGRCSFIHLHRRPQNAFYYQLIIQAPENYLQIESKRRLSVFSEMQMRSNNAGIIGQQYLQNETYKDQQIINNINNLLFEKILDQQKYEDQMVNKENYAISNNFQNQQQNSCFDNKQQNQFKDMRKLQFMPSQQLLQSQQSMNQLFPSTTSSSTKFRLLTNFQQGGKIADKFF